MSFVNFCITYNAVNQRSASHLELPPIRYPYSTYFPTDPVAGMYDDDHPSTPDSRAHTHSCHAWLSSSFQAEPVQRC